MVQDQIAQALSTALDPFGLSWATDGLMDSLDAAGALDDLPDDDEDDDFNEDEEEQG